MSTYTSTSKDGIEFDSESEELSELSEQSYQNMEVTSLQRLIQALQVMDEAGVKFLPGAGHDELYGPSASELTYEQIKKLYSLTWYVNSDTDTFYTFV